MNNIQIFLDMDNVVADFKAYANHVLTGHTVDNGYRFPDDQWQRLRDNPRIYRDLPLKPGAIELVKYCQQICDINDGTLQFLTALPRKNDIPYAIYDKVQWADRFFPGIPVFFGLFSPDKQNYCKGDNYILIDDRLDNCQQWINQGGLAHQYKNWADCQIWLTGIVNG